MSIRTNRQKVGLQGQFFFGRLSIRTISNFVLKYFFSAEGPKYLIKVVYGVHDEIEKQALLQGKIDEKYVFST